MPDFLHALQSGATHLWLFIPAAILLGALHGLEPGHSKTMMAAFIVAIRGTIGQAVLLGPAAFTVYWSACNSNARPWALLWSVPSALASP